MSIHDVPVTQQAYTPDVLDYILGLPSQERVAWLGSLTFEELHRVRGWGIISRKEFVTRRDQLPAQEPPRHQPTNQPYINEFISQLHGRVDRALAKRDEEKERLLRKHHYPFQKIDYGEQNFDHANIITYKDAKESGFIEPHEYHYGGQRICIKEKIFVRFPYEAVSATQWRRLGYKIKGETAPYCYRAYPNSKSCYVYRHDQMTTAINLPPRFMWLKNTSLQITLAIKESKDFTQLPILADALEDEGCDFVELLHHFRDNLKHKSKCSFFNQLLGTYHTPFGCDCD